MPLRDFVDANVRFGSKADIGEGAIDVRFVPKADILQAECYPNQKWA
jgi:hypothetical protein